MPETQETKVKLRVLAEQIAPDRAPSLVVCVAAFAGCMSP